MDRLSGWPITPVEEFLLEANHPVLADAHRAGLSHAAAVRNDFRLGLLATGGAGLPVQAKASEIDQSKYKWPRLHADMYWSQGLRWEVAQSFSDQDLIVFPGLASLTQREVEVLELAGIKQFPEEPGRLIETSQKAGRATPRTGSSPAIIPRGRVYLTDKCRLMDPVEALRLQSLHFPEHVLRTTEPRVLQSLAGNAFEGGCCLATIVATCTALAHGAASRAARAPSMEVDSDSESGVSLLL